MTSQTNDLLSRMGFTLPLVGENHPLRKSFLRTFVWSATIAMLIHGAVAAGRIIAVNFLMKPPEAPVRFHEISLENLPPPPITEEEAPPQVNLAAQVSQPAIGIPDPVPDYEAEELTVATEQEMSEAQTADLDALFGSGDSLVVSFGDALPRPDDYVAMEEAPTLISMPKPEYPAFAREHGIEGIVVLQALVDTNGDVREVRFISGNEHLKEAAIDAAKKAKFKPAQQQHRPVASWVRMPMNFSLRS
jgi:protein TonB